MEEDPDCWFTPEQIAQAKENRRRLEEEWAKNPPPLSREEFRQVLLNGPVATEEEIQALEEINGDDQRPAACDVQSKTF